MFFRKNLPLIIAVLVSILVIGTSWYLVRVKKNEEAKNFEIEETVVPTEKLNLMRGLQADDHILGNPNAPVLLFVFSDFGCEYCGDYHETLRSIMRVFGMDGKVAIIFRHMPYVQLHPESPKYAHATECVAEAKGNGGFWTFADGLFKAIDPLKAVSDDELVKMVMSMGIDSSAFISCMSSNKYMERIEEDFKEGVASGAEGTPYTIIDVGGERVEFQGAQAYKSLAITLQTLVRKLEAEAGMVDDGVNENGEVSFKNTFEYGISVGSTSSSSMEVSTQGTQASSTDTTEEKTPAILQGVIFD